MKAMILIPDYQLYPHIHWRKKMDTQSSTSTWYNLPFLLKKGFFWGRGFGKEVCPTFDYSSFVWSQKVFCKDRGRQGEGVLSGDLNHHLTSLISVFPQSNLCVRLNLIIDLCICNYKTVCINAMYTYCGYMLRSKYLSSLL